MYAPTTGKAQIETESCAKRMMLPTTVSISQGPLPVNFKDEKVVSRSERPQIRPVRAQRAMSVRTPSMTLPCKYQTPRPAMRLEANMRWTVVILSPMDQAKREGFFNSRNRLHEE